MCVLTDIFFFPPGKFACGKKLFLSLYEKCLIMIAWPLMSEYSIAKGKNFYILHIPVKDPHNRENILPE